MGLIPRPFIDDLLSQTDIVAFIDSLVPLKKQGHNFVACCPFHHEKTPSFNVIAKKQFYHCFGCGVSGNAISFAMQYLNQSFVEAIEILAQRAGLSVPREANASPQPQVNLYQLLAYVALFYQKTLMLGEQPALAYLKARGVEGDVLTRYQLGYAPRGWKVLTQTKAFRAHQASLITTGMLIQKEHQPEETYDRYRHRLMFPIHDKKGRIIGFGGRALEKEDKPKYLNSPETLIFHKNRELYGLFQVLEQNKHPQSIIVVEGYMDVIALAQNGIPNAVATLGTATSPFHIQLLAQYTPHIIFCFDGDTAGLQAAHKALESLLPALDSTLTASFIFLPEAHDPDSYIRAFGPQGFQKALEEALPLHQYLLQLIQQNVDLSTVQGKNQLMHQAKPLLDKIPESPFKSLMLQELATRTHLEAAHLKQLLTTPAPPPQVQQTIRRTPSRIAVALLLQYPDAYRALEKTYPAKDFQEHAMITELMNTIHTCPNLSTAALVERFRESTSFEVIQKLASFETLVHEDTVQQELSDTLAFLHQKTHEQEIQTLLKRAKEQGLSTEERLQLQQLVKQKKQMPNH